MDTGASRAFFALYAATVLFFGWFNGIAVTEPKPVSLSAAVAKQVEASEGPERAGHKPLMRNPSAIGKATPTGITAADTFTQVEVVTAYAVITEPKP